MGAVSYCLVLFYHAHNTAAAEDSHSWSMKPPQLRHTQTAPCYASSVSSANERPSPDGHPYTLPTGQAECSSDLYIGVEQHYIFCLHLSSMPDCIRQRKPWFLFQQNQVHRRKLATEHCHGSIRGAIVRHIHTAPSACRNALAEGKEGTEHITSVPIQYD